MLIHAAFKRQGVEIPHRISRRRSAQLLRFPLKGSDWTFKRVRAFTSTYLVAAAHTEDALGKFIYS